jgi:hypothetical protein
VIVDEASPDRPHHRNNIDLISFRGEKSPQDLPQPAIVLNHQNPLRWNRWQIEVFEVDAKLVAAISFPLSCASGSDETNLSIAINQER